MCECVLCFQVQCGIRDSVIYHLGRWHFVQRTVSKALSVTKILDTKGCRESMQEGFNVLDKMTALSVRLGMYTC